MHEVPECLNRRYRALDKLIQELGSKPQKSTENERSGDSDDPGIKLMCDFWNILKEDPNCDLPKLVQKRMCPESQNTHIQSPSPTMKPGIFNHPQRIMCYMANETTTEDSGTSRKRLSENNPKNIQTCCVSKQSSAASSNATNDLPLSKVLCNLKEAASFDKKCAARINDLLTAEKTLQGQITKLEDKEKQGVVLLKEADCMWSCMENAYKEKIADSLERQKDLLQQLKEVEKSMTKWRRNKKDLESQLDSIAKAQLEINQKISRKTNDIKSLKVEIDGFKKRMEANKKATEVVKKSTEPMKKASSARIDKITAEMKRLEALEKSEEKAKLDKDAEGAAYIKEAREDLQKICKALLQKQLEKEDLAAEKNSLLQEIDLLKSTCDMCKDKCKRKQDSLGQDLNKVEAELAAFKVKCLKCTQCTDTSDQRYFCNDCPRCAAHRECLIEGDTCSTDNKEACVCQIVKQKLLDNVFENMYTVLERQIQSPPGKAIADQVLKTLKSSRNGKLNAGTRNILQEFILTTVKKNLNLTIVGGAVKTRCELDPDTYKQLMLCLTPIKATRVPHSDKGTESKKDPCKRWGGSKECHCPRGPKDCVCTKKAPPSSRGQRPCPPLPVDKEDQGEVIKCPHKKDTVCGLECSMHTPNKVAADVSKWKPDSCEGPSCPYSKNMRAAQCVIGSERIEPFDLKNKFGRIKEKQFTQDPKNFGMIKPSDMHRNSGTYSELEQEVACNCGDVPIRFCSCREDAKQLKLDDGRKFFISRKRCLMEGLPYKNTVRGRNKINESHQIASKQSLDTPPGKGNLKPGVDQKVMLEEKNLENVDKVDEILALECNGVEKTAEAIRPKIIEAHNNKTTASSGFAHETVTSENKSMESSIIKKQVPNAIKSQENNMNLTHTHIEYKGIETVEIVKPSGYVVHTTDDILTSEYKSVVTIEKAISEPLRNNVNITDTPSGTIAMEVESTFLDNLEKKLMENPNMHVYLRKLNSGHLTVDLKPQENVSNLKIQVTKSSTGEIQFVLLKNLSTYIMPCESCESVCEQVTDVESIVLKVIRRDCKLKGTPSDSRKVCNESQRDGISKQRQAAKKTARMGREDIRNFIEDKLLNEIPNQTKVHTCRLTDKEKNSKELFKTETNIFYDNNRGKLTLNVQGANGAKACVEASLTKTPSGNIAMDIKNINCIGVIAESSKECPVLLKKSASGVYNLFVGYQEHEEPNTVLKRTASGQMLIVITEPVLRSLHLPVPPLKELVQEKLYKVRVKGASSRVTALPAFLKTTSSGNYILVLDKEFEKQFNNHITNSMNDHTQCHIELHKTASDAIIINFDKVCTENTCHNKQNALLVKTSSGHLRILVNGEEDNNSLSQNLLKVNSHRSSQAFEELLQHIHTLSIPSCSQSKNVAESSFRKQSSDSQLLDSDRNSHLTIFDRPIKIQKTPSGQYTVVLDKNSKKAFLIDLKNYLSVNTKGLVPVRRMGSGDIMIVLDTKGQSTDLYGSLTITPSGNIYVTMDENVLKALSTTPSGMTDLGSRHIIKKVKHPENKGVDTNCNTHLEACLCDSSCVCRDLLECVDKSKKSQAIKCGYLNKTRNSFGRNLPCNPSKCYASCSTKNRFTRTSNTEQPPCECVNPSYSNQQNIQQSYYVYDSVYSAHEILSNELLVASSPCSENGNNMSSSDILDDSVKEFTSFTSNESVDFSTYDWNYLPPQLPSFLGNFKPVLIS